MKNIFIIVSLFFLFSCDKIERVEGRLPIPTEYSVKKSIRKDFKNLRKEYILNMHRSNPADDWKEMDKISRINKKLEIKDIRQNLFDKNINFTSNYVENISRDLSGSWVERGSNNLSGRIRTADIDWDNGFIYCASSGGNIWRGTLQGLNWTSLNDYLQIKGVSLIRKINNDNLNRLLIVAEHNIFYTDNEGITIEESSGLDFLDDGHKIKRAIISEVDNSIYILVNTRSYNPWGTVASIYKSIDSGRTFSLYVTLNQEQGFDSLQDYDNFDIWTSRYFEGDIYVLNNNKVYTIGDLDNIIFRGDIPSNLSGDNKLVGGTGANGKFLYALIGNHIYSSINSGITWVDRGEKPQWLFMINSFNCSNINTSNVYWGGMEAFKSTNSGQNWQLVNNWWDYYGNEETMLHADIPEIRFFLDPEFNELSLVSTDGGIYISYNNLESVQNLSMNGLGVSQYYSTYTKRRTPYHLYAGSQDQGFQRTLNPSNQGSLNFEQSISGDYGHIVSGDNGTTLWTNYPGFSMYYTSPTTQGGGYTLDFPFSGGLWIAPLMEDPYDESNVYLGGGGNNGGHHIFHLLYQNSNISFNEGSYNFNGKISAMAYSPLENNYRYLLTENGTFYYSNNDGLSWNQNSSFDGPNAHYFYGSSIWASKSISGKVIISGSGYSNPAVYVSYDHGESFEAMDNHLPNTLVFKVVGTDNDDYYFAATELGPYVYISEDHNWVNLSGVNAPDQTYWSVEYIDALNTARFGTYGRGIWDFVIDFTDNLNGDVNLDQNINVQDVVLLVSFILNLAEPTSEQFEVSDLNFDEILNVVDIINLINIILEN